MKSSNSLKFIYEKRSITDADKSYLHRRTCPNCWNEGWYTAIGYYNIRVYINFTWFTSYDRCVVCYSGGIQKVCVKHFKQLVSVLRRV